MNNLQQIVFDVMQEQPEETWSRQGCMEPSYGKVCQAGYARQVLAPLALDGYRWFNGIFGNDLGDSLITGNDVAHTLDQAKANIRQLLEGHFGTI
jgi:hypothetical protein